MLQAKDESLDQLIARADSARPEDRPALYLEIARQKADIADQFYHAAMRKRRCQPARSRDFLQEGDGRIH